MRNRKLIRGFEGYVLKFSSNLFRAGLFCCSQTAIFQYIGGFSMGYLSVY